MRILFLLSTGLLFACTGQKPSRDVDNKVAEAPLAPPAPGQPGGLPDDRTPLAEGPIDPKSAQGAGQVLQSYFALIEAGRHDEAWRLWSDGGRASGMSAAEFAASFAPYAEYHADIGAPGRIEGAAGSAFVEVPVQIYGRLRSGAPFSRRGTMTLRRVNDVPGATPEQLQWRIFRSDIPAVEAAAPAAPRFVGRWASDVRSCRTAAWEFTATSLATSAGSQCRFSRVTEVPGGYDIAARCTAEGLPAEDVLRLRFAQSARALLFESRTIADAGLVACP
ncbi:MAG: hypothetical protein ACK4SZ_16470 [Allosphingosinicella sp.]|uniref:hypothetical protein n=1 Tax=Allosphingosinicella sp. TaxID=2823234 RepID=UPI00392BCDFB